MRKIQLNILLLVTLIVAVFFPIVIFNGFVNADDVNVYPNVDTYIREDNQADHGNEAYFYVCNYINDPWRTLIKIDDQSGGGNVTQVILYLRYLWYNINDPVGEKVRVYRLTTQFCENEANWAHNCTGQHWVSLGGDYTTANYAEATVPSSQNSWMSFNITDMAKYEWDQGKDLYIIVRFKYESKDIDSYSRIAYVSSDNTDYPSYKPYCVVSYAEAVQTPSVEVGIHEIGAHYCIANILPNLYDWPSANVSAQVSLHGQNNWTFESDILNITTSNQVERTVTGLNKSTNYDVRAKLVYGGGTVYSNSTEFTTQAYEIPIWEIDVDNVEVNSAQVYAGWSNNTDLKTVYARIEYKSIQETEWHYTSYNSSASNSSQFNWDITDLGDSENYTYKGKFLIDSYAYETDTDWFYTGSMPEVEASIEEKGINYVYLKVDYWCNDADEVDLQCKIKRVGTSDWIESSILTGRTGNGTEYFMFEGLLAMTQYEYWAMATYIGGATIDATDNFFWTEEIGELPTIDSPVAEFIGPNIMRLSANIILNDALTYNPTLHFKLKDYSIVESYWITQNVSVTGNGISYVDLICGDILEWDHAYDFIGVLDYTVGYIETVQSNFQTPVEPFWVTTLDPLGVSGTSVYLRGQLQMGEIEGGLTHIKFYYWVTGTSGKIITEEVEVTSSGIYQQRLDGLIYGQSYSYQFYCAYGNTYGNTITFICGYWEGGGGGGGELPTIDITDVFSFVSWLFHTTAGHWLLILMAMGLTALIFFRKHRIVALVLCLCIFGLGIVIGWVDPWVVVLLGIVGGIIIWRMVVSNRSPV